MISHRSSVVVLRLVFQNTEDLGRRGFVKENPRRLMKIYSPRPSTTSTCREAISLYSRIPIEPLNQRSQRAPQHHHHHYLFLVTINASSPPSTPLLHLYYCVELPTGSWKLRIGFHIYMLPFPRCPQIPALPLGRTRLGLKRITALP